MADPDIASTLLSGKSPREMLLELAKTRSTGQSAFRQAVQKDDIKSAVSNRREGLDEQRSLMQEMRDIRVAKSGVSERAYTGTTAKLNRLRQVADQPSLSGSLRENLARAKTEAGRQIMSQPEDDRGTWDKMKESFRRGGVASTLAGSEQSIQHMMANAGTPEEQYQASTALSAFREIKDLYQSAVSDDPLVADDPEAFLGGLENILVQGAGQGKATWNVIVKNMAADLAISVGAAALTPYSGGASSVLTATRIGKTIQNLTGLGKAVKASSQLTGAAIGSSRAAKVAKLAIQAKEIGITANEFYDEAYTGIFNNIYDHTGDAQTAGRIANVGSLLSGAVESFISPSSMLGLPSKVGLVPSMKNMLHQMWGESTAAVLGRFVANRVAGTVGELSEEGLQGGIEAVASLMGAAHSKDPEVMNSMIEEFQSRLKGAEGVEGVEKVQGGLVKLVSRMMAQSVSEAAPAVVGLGLLGVPAGMVEATADIRGNRNARKAASEGIESARTSLAEMGADDVVADNLISTFSEGTKSREHWLARMEALGGLGTEFSQFMGQTKSLDTAMAALAEVRGEGEVIKSEAAEKAAAEIIDAATKTYAATTGLSPEARIAIMDATLDAHTAKLLEQTGQADAKTEEVKAENITNREDDVLSRKEEIIAAGTSVKSNPDYAELKETMIKRDGKEAAEAEIKVITERQRVDGVEASKLEAEEAAKEAEEQKRVDDEKRANMTAQEKIEHDAELDHVISKLDEAEAAGEVEEVNSTDKIKRFLTEDLGEPMLTWIKKNLFEIYGNGRKGKPLNSLKKFYADRDNVATNDKRWNSKEGIKEIIDSHPVPLVLDQRVWWSIRDRKATRNSSATLRAEKAKDAGVPPKADLLATKTGAPPKANLTGSQSGVPPKANLTGSNTDTGQPTISEPTQDSTTPEGTTPPATQPDVAPVSTEVRTLSHLTGEEFLLFAEVDPENTQTEEELTAIHKGHIEQSIQKGSEGSVNQIKVNAEAAAAYGIPLPDGWTEADGMFVAPKVEAPKIDTEYLGRSITALKNALEDGGSNADPKIALALEKKLLAADAAELGIGQSAEPVSPAQELARNLAERDLDAALVKNPELFTPIEKQTFTDSQGDQYETEHTYTTEQNQVVFAVRKMVKKDGSLVPSNRLSLMAQRPATNQFSDPTKVKAEGDVDRERALGRSAEEVGNLHQRTTVTREEATDALKHLVAEAKPQKLVTLGDMLTEGTMPEGQRDALERKLDGIKANQYQANKSDRALAKAIKLALKESDARVLAHPEKDDGQTITVVTARLKRGINKGPEADVEVKEDWPRTEAVKWLRNFNDAMTNKAKVRNGENVQRMQELIEILSREESSLAEDLTHEEAVAEMNVLLHEGKPRGKGKRDTPLMKLIHSSGMSGRRETSLEQQIISEALGLSEDGDITFGEFKAAGNRIAANQKGMTKAKKDAMMASLWRSLDLSMSGKTQRTGQSSIEQARESGRELGTTEGTTNADEVNFDDEKIKQTPTGPTVDKDGNKIEPADSQTRGTSARFQKAMTPEAYGDIVGNELPLMVQTLARVDMDIARERVASDVIESADPNATAEELSDALEDAAEIYRAENFTAADGIEAVQTTIRIHSASIAAAKDLSNENKTLTKDQRDAARNKTMSRITDGRSRAERKIANKIKAAVAERNAEKQKSIPQKVAKIADDFIAVMSAKNKEFTEVDDTVVNVDQSKALIEEYGTVLTAADNDLSDSAKVAKIAEKLDFQILQAKEQGDDAKKKVLIATKRRFNAALKKKPKPDGKTRGTNVELRKLDAKVKAASEKRAAAEKALARTTSPAVSDNFDAPFTKTIIRLEREQVELRKKIRTRVLTKPSATQKKELASLRKQLAEKEAAKAAARKSRAEAKTNPDVKKAPNPSTTPSSKLDDFYKAPAKLEEAQDELTLIHKAERDAIRARDNARDAIVRLSLKEEQDAILDQFRDEINPLLENSDTRKETADSLLVELKRVRTSLRALSTLLPTQLTDSWRQDESAPQNSLQRRELVKRASEIADFDVLNNGISNLITSVEDLVSRTTKIEQGKRVRSDPNKATEARLNAKIHVIDGIIARKENLIGLARQRISNTKTTTAERNKLLAPIDVLEREVQDLRGQRLLEQEALRNSQTSTESYRLQRSEEAIGAKIGPKELLSFIKATFGGDAKIPKDGGLIWEGELEGGGRVAIYGYHGLTDEGGGKLAGKVQIKEGQATIVYDLDNMTVTTPAHETKEHIGVAGLDEASLEAVARHLGVWKKGVPRLDIRNTDGETTTMGMEERVVQALDRVDVGLEKADSFTQQAVRILKRIIAAVGSWFGVDYNFVDPIKVIKDIDSGAAMRAVLQGKASALEGTRYSKAKKKADLTYAQARALVGDGALSKWQSLGMPDGVFAKWLFKEAGRIMEARSGGPDIKSVDRSKEILRRQELMGVEEVADAEGRVTGGGKDSFKTSAFKMFTTLRKVSYDMIAGTDLARVISDDLYNDTADKRSEAVGVYGKFMADTAAALADTSPEVKRAWDRNSFKKYAIGNADVELTFGQSLYLAQQLMATLAARKEGARDPIGTMLKKAGISFPSQRALSGQSIVQAQMANTKLKTTEEVEAALGSIRKNNPLAIEEALRLDAVNKKFTPLVRKVVAAVWGTDAGFKERDFFAHVVRDHSAEFEQEVRESRQGASQRQSLGQANMLTNLDVNKPPELQDHTGFGDAPLVVLDAYDMYMKSMNSMGMFVAAGEMVANEQAFWNDGGTMRRLVGHFGNVEQAKKFRTAAKRDLETMGGEFVNQGEWKRFIGSISNKALSNAARAFLSSPRVSAMQYASKANEGSHFTAEELVKAKGLTVSEKEMDRLLELTPMVKHRATGGQTQLSNVMGTEDSLFGASSAALGPRSKKESIDAILNLGMSGTSYVDKKTIRSIVHPAMARVIIGKPHLVRGTKEFEEAVAKEWRTAALATQVQTTPFNRSMMQRSKDPFARGFTYMRGARSVSASAILSSVEKVFAARQRWSNAKAEGDHAAAKVAEEEVAAANKNFLRQVLYHGMLQQAIVQVFRKGSFHGINAIGAAMYGDDGEGTDPIEIIEDFLKDGGKGVASLFIGGPEVIEFFNMTLGKGWQAGMAGKRIQSSLHPIFGTVDEFSRVAGDGRRRSAIATQLDTGLKANGERMTSRERMNLAKSFDSVSASWAEGVISSLSTWVVGAPYIRTLVGTNRQLRKYKETVGK